MTQQITLVVELESNVIPVPEWLEDDLKAIIEGSSLGPDFDNIRLGTDGEVEVWAEKIVSVTL